MAEPDRRRRRQDRVPLPRECSRRYALIRANAAL